LLPPPAEVSRGAASGGDLGSPSVTVVVVVGGGVPPLRSPPAPAHVSAADSPSEARNVRAASQRPLLKSGKVSGYGMLSSASSSEGASFSNFSSDVFVRGASDPPVRLPQQTWQCRPWSYQAPTLPTPSRAASPPRAECVWIPRVKYRPRNNPRSTPGTLGTPSSPP